MFGKLNIKILTIVFVILLAGVILAQWLQNRGNERNFRSSLAQIDTSEISAIIIKPAKSHLEIRLEKTGNTWSVVFNSRKYRVNKPSLQALLSGLTQLKTESLVSSSTENWKEYEVTDSLGTHVKVEGKGKTLVSMIIGKFSYQQGSQTVKTYARLADEDDVYALNGFLAMNFNQNINSLRFNNIGSGSVADISKLTFSYPADSSFIISKAGNKWNLDGKDIDSTWFMNYLQTLTTLTGTEFAYDNLSTGNPLYTLKVEGNGDRAFEILAFASDSTNRFYVTSTVNPGAKFIETKDGLISRIFVSKKSFLKAGLK